MIMYLGLGAIALEIFFILLRAHDGFSKAETRKEWLMDILTDLVCRAVFILVWPVAALVLTICVFFGDKSGLE